jgi:hypothetical protein
MLNHLQKVQLQIIRSEGLRILILEGHQISLLLQLMHERVQAIIVIPIIQEVQMPKSPIRLIMLQEQDRVLHIAADRKINVVREQQPRLRDKGHIIPVIQNPVQVQAIILQEIQPKGRQHTEVIQIIPVVVQLIVHRDHQVQALLINLMPGQQILTEADQLTGRRLRIIQKVAGAHLHTGRVVIQAVLL